MADDEPQAPDGPLRLDIFADPVCPWCLIGATHLTRALAARPELAVALAWHPFQLDPDMPREGMARADYIARRFGGLHNTGHVKARVEAAAAEAGLTLNLDAITRSPNTLDAHRLIRWAGAAGVQTAVAIALFERYNVGGEDISDPVVLAAVAANAGMDAEVVTQRLASDMDCREVAQEAAEARRGGIDGVPAVLIQGRYLVTGAQPQAFWIDLLDQVAAAAG